MIYDREEKGVEEEKAGKSGTRKIGKDAAATTAAAAAG